MNMRPKVDFTGYCVVLYLSVIPFPATAIRRKRGQSLSRRIGQTGNVFQRNKPWSPTAPTYGRYWIDLPGCPDRKRRTVSLGTCSSRSVARRKLREHIQVEGINSKESFLANTAPTTTFRAQAAKWIASLPTRRRKPVKPATVFGWQHALDKWVLPELGDKFLGDVSNGALRDFIEKMAAAGLSAKTIVNYSQVVKLVLASAVDAEGDQIYPRKWNHDFIGLPIVKKEGQHRPTVTETGLGEILASAKERYALIFALLAGTGLRIGEALALKPTDLSPDCRVAEVHGQQVGVSVRHIQRATADTAQRPTGIARDRKENRSPRFPAIPHRDVAACPRARRLNNAVARPLKENCN